MHWRFRATAAEDELVRVRALCTPRLVSPAALSRAEKAEAEVEKLQDELQKLQLTGQGEDKAEKKGNYIISLI